jgi:hypothetical protein
MADGPSDPRVFYLRKSDDHLDAKKMQEEGGDGGDVSEMRRKVTELDL